MKERTQLKDCPFCGSAADRHRFMGASESAADSPIRYMIFCTSKNECPATNARSYGSEVEADTHWNARLQSAEH